MKRKVIQLASNTLVVSLPAKWAQANNILKGSEVNIDPKENMLLVSKDGTNTNQEKVIKVNIDGMPKTLLYSYLISLYQSGVSEIQIEYSSQDISDIKDNKKIRTVDAISNITDRLIGMEIIRQSKNLCILREITNGDSKEYNNIMNRIFLSLKNYSVDILDAIKEDDFDTLRNIFVHSESHINKLSDYCIRLLNSVGYNDFRQTSSFYLMIFLLEEIGDSYTKIAKYIVKNKCKIDKAYFNRLVSTGEALNYVHKLSMNSKKEFYIKFHEVRNEIKKEIKKEKSNKKELDIVLLEILDKLMNVSNSIVISVGQL